MKKCNCCKKEKDTVDTYVLPEIGFGSVFDSGVIGQFKFNVCPECAFKINKWLKKKVPNINLEEFWACAVVKKPYDDESGMYYYEFENEEMLITLFEKFMPEVIYGNHHKVKKIIAKLLL